MLVSILIPCHNAAHWIAPCIESALAQTWTEKEVIVVDDGSTDGSLGIIRSFGEKIRFESGPNRGGNAARNRLLELARGEWLQYLDADDYLLPDKVSSQMVFLGDHPEVDVVFGPVTLEHHSEDAEPRRELLVIPAPHDPWILLARWFLPQTGSPLWRKSAVVEVGGWKAGQPCCQEHELYLRLLMAGKRFEHHEAGGAIYRQWSEGTVCRRDIAEVHRRRMEIERGAETFLRARGMLASGRLYAINQARFEIARIAWSYDRAFAESLVREIRETDAGFVPSGRAAPWHYRLIWRLCGFRAAESVAAVRRRAFSWAGGTRRTAHV
jgi:glycosyltransferase involved in cell wall biosynthesis